MPNETIQKNPYTEDTFLIGICGMSCVMYHSFPLAFTWSLLVFSTPYWMLLQFLVLIE